MDRALVIGASGGIGSALANELEQRGSIVSRLSRRDDGFDITDEAMVDQLLAGVGPFEAVFVASGKLAGAGNPPEKSLRALTGEAMLDQFRVNAIGPALVLKHLPRLLPRQGDSFCGVLSARVGSIGDNRLGGWYSYRAAKAALNQLVHGAAIELARTHKSARLIALHPGTVATSFTEGFEGRDKLTPEQSACHLVNVMLSRTADQTGTFWDWQGQEVPW
ncbi:MAG: SDR family oxidoreductase [Rhodobacteraceae bacterium]|nr:SDR family oxidoreductase [Paracoccaceae bacterium]